jgi:hypothetical protein
MTSVRKADPAWRRRVLVLAAIGASIAALLIGALGRYRTALVDWIIADPAATADRVGLVVAVSMVVSLGPLLGFAASIWAVGGRAVRSREFPPPGLRVIRDTRVITDDAAVRRGHVLRLLAVSCALAGVGVGVFLWHLQSLINGS